MQIDEGLSWKDQLKSVREHVVGRAQQRERDKKLQRERNAVSLQKRLKEDTPEALNQRANDIRKVSDRAARKLYPLPHIEAVMTNIGQFGDLLRFYSDCLRPFARVFSPAHKTTLANLLRDMGALQRGLDRQMGQWRELKDLIQKTVFRPRQAQDEADLVAVAKEFSEHAHSVPLSIPGDFFQHERDNFWVAECEGTVLGYVKYWPDDKVITFALRPPHATNFKKFIRGLIYKFCADGPIPEKGHAVRVRIGFVREVKFFTDIGFVRSETKGPTEWIYQRELN